jgi:hypothetical protein
MMRKLHGQMQSNSADYTKNSELITYEEFQIRVTDRVTVSASNKDTWWRLVLQPKKPDMALAFQVREELSAIKSSWKNDRVGFIINQFKRGDIETQEIGEKRRA